MPDQAVKALMKTATLNAVRFIQPTIPSDIADRFNGGKATSQEGEIEVIIRPKGTGYLDMKSILGLLSGEKKVGDLLELKSFEPKNVKAEISVDGRRRVIDFGRLGRLKATFDVSDEVTIGENGYATIGSLRTSSAALVLDLAQQLKISS